MVKGFRNVFSPEKGDYLTGSLLVAMPFVQEDLLSQSVIFICRHDKEGAIGLIINKTLESIKYKDFLRQVGIPFRKTEKKSKTFSLCCGGSSEVTRGFILHSCDYKGDATVEITASFSLSSTLDILRALAEGEGPSKFLVCLGYMGWRAGQLEAEIVQDTWLVSRATEALVFESDMASKWRQSMASLGVDPTILSFTSGHT